MNIIIRYSFALGSPGSSPKTRSFLFFLPQLHSITAENPKFGFTFTPNTFFKAGVFTNPSGRFILSKHQFSNFASGNNGLFIWGNEKPRILSSDPDHEASMGCNVANHLYQTLSYKHQNILHSSLVIQVLLIFSFYIAFKLGIPKINIYMIFMVFSLLPRVPSLMQPRVCRIDHGPSTFPE